MADERVGLQLDVNGLVQYGEAIDRVVRLEREFAQLQSQIDRNAMGWELARQRIGAVKVELEGARRAADAFATSQRVAAPGMMGGVPGMGAGQIIAGAGAAGGGWMARNSANMGMAVFQAGALIEDAQYGFRAIANNLPMLAINIGQMAGMTATAAMGLGGLAAVVTTATGAIARMSSAAGGPADGPVFRAGGWSYYTDVFAAQKAAEAKRQQQADEKEKREVEFGQTMGARASDAARRRGSQFMEDFDQVGGQTIADRMEDALREYKDIFGTTLNPVTGNKAKSSTAVIGQLISDAQSGDQASIDWIRKNAKLDSGPLAGLTEAILGDLKDATDVAAFERIAAEQERVQGLYDKGALSAKDYQAAQKQLATAMEQVSDRARAAADASIAAADAMEKKRASEAEENRKDWNSQMERRDANYVRAYGQAFGGNVSRALMARMMNGEGGDTATAALMPQLMARMGRLDPAQRDRVANAIMDQAQAMAEQQMAFRDAGRDAWADNMQRNLAPANTAMGRVQRSMLNRQGMLAGQFAGRAARMAEQFANSPEAKQMGAAEVQMRAALEFKQTVDELRARGIQVTL
jgi:hypothetical protein